MKIIMWKKLRSIQIPGSTWVPCLMGLLLGTTMGLSIALPLRQPAENTSEESIFGPNESLELVLILETGEELQLRVTGKNTTEVVQSLRRMLEDMDGTILTGKSYLYI